METSRLLFFKKLLISPARYSLVILSTLTNPKKSSLISFEELTYLATRDIYCSVPVVLSSTDIVKTLASRIFFMMSFFINPSAIRYIISFWIVLLIYVAFFFDVFVRCFSRTGLYFPISFKSSRKLHTLGLCKFIGAGDKKSEPTEVPYPISPVSERRY